MIGAALLLPLLAGASLRTAGNLSQERLDVPGAAPWSEANASVVLLGDAWRGGTCLRLLDRYDLTDGSLGLVAGVRSGDLDLEAEVDRGFRRRFAADATLRTSLRWTFRSAWTAGAEVRILGFQGTASVAPEGLLETYIGPFRLEARANLPVSDGTILDPGGRLTGEWWWSDKGATGISAGRSSEAEAGSQGSLLTTRVTTLGWTARTSLGSATTLRGALTWTRQGALHDRWGFGMGVEHDFPL